MIAQDAILELVNKLHLELPVEEIELEAIRKPFTEAIEEWLDGQGVEYESYED